MPKKQWEADAQNRFLDFLRNHDRHDYISTAENVVTNSLTGRDYDYELTPHTQGPPIIALEIFRLIGDEPDLAHQQAWNDVVRQLKAELKAREVTGYLIRTPHFKVPKFKRKQFASETADIIAAAIAANPHKDEFNSNGYAFYKLPGNPPVHSCISPISEAFDRLTRLDRSAKLWMTSCQRRMSN